MTAAWLSRSPRHALLASLCAGIGAANAVRLVWAVAVAAAGAGAVFVVRGGATARLTAFAVGLALLGWWWGSARLAALDRSVLIADVGRAERAQVVVTAPARGGRFELRVPAQVLRFGDLRLHEAVLLELPLGRSPPQGARLDVLGQIALPRGPHQGFDERTWLRRHGVHVILRVDRWRIEGRRGGLGGIADRLRTRLSRSIARGLHGERRAVVEGVVLGDDGGLSDTLRRRFQASGLYHLLAVSGENVALVALGILICAWLAGIPRALGQIGALVGIGSYVMAVGAQPSVIRAGIAGALGSLAWLTARARDRTYVLLLGALALLAWNPYVLLDAGFELSFTAVGAIFLLVPPLQRELEGYPVPRRLATVVAVSAACGLATAPILWLQFHAVPLLTVPANALAAPVVAPLLGLALAAAAIGPVAPSAAAVLTWLNGWCAAYLATCARIVGGLPFAQVRSTAGAAALAVSALVLACGWRLRSRR